jgi:hypothetical protein
MGLELLAVPLALALAAWGLAGLLVHAMASLVARASGLKRYTAKQMLIAAAVNGTGSLCAAGRAVARMLGWVLRWWLFFLIVFLFFSTLYVTFTELPESWLGAARVYNRFVGPYAHQVVLMPLRVVDLLLRALIPLWNSFFWFFKTLATQGLLPIVIEQLELLVRMATGLVALVQHLCLELARLFGAFTTCRGVACLRPEQGVIDLLTSMADVREIAATGASIARAFCSTLAAPLDLLVYPLLDLNLAEAVHNLGNAALQFLVVMPRDTVVRCAAKENNQYGVLMCTPDLNPTFNFLAASLGSLGLAIDNWLNVALLIVETVVGMDPPRCATTDNAMIPDILARDSAFVLPAVVVGLTDWMYAVTDGRTAIYMGHNDGLQAKLQSWPYPVDAGLGVAAVTYAGAQDLDATTFSSGKTTGSLQTTAMLGCNCTDTADEGMRVTCAVLPLSGIPTGAALADYRLEALFSDARAPGLYTCAGVDLYVKPVRWSYTRYETQAATLGSGGGQTTLPTHDCISRGTCRELDATVWLVPRCGQDVSQNAPTACIQTAPCYPYCMAARAAGSGRANLVFVRAARWREGVTLLGQDCALGRANADTVQLGMPSSGSASRATSTAQGLLQTGGTEVYGFGTSRVCAATLGVTSTVARNASALSAAGPRVAYNVVLDGQPFALTGDTALTAVDLGGNARSVHVERLAGDEVDVFSLNGISQQLPAHPMAVVPLEQADLDTQDRLTIPYGYQTTRIAATTSRNYVFYASNPNADVLGPYLEYCANKDDPDKLSKFGILFLSSYSQIRVYRVSAYRRCAAYSCGDDLARFVTFAGFSRKFGRECDEVFNVSVAALEYLNEDNVAVTLESSPVRAWDAATATFRNATRKTYWLNPTTMRVKDTIWQTDPASSDLPTQIPQLCPALQRLPRVGSFAAEVLSAGVFLLRFAVFAVTYTPGLVAVWSAGPACPQPGSALYHSVLANCGERVYSLDDFFDSLDDAGKNFWHSLSLVARLITPSSRPGIAAPIVNVLDGMSQYGQGAVDVWAGGQGVLLLAQVPIKEQAMELWAVMQAGAVGDAGRILQGLSMPGAGALAYARFVYRVFSTFSLELLKRFLDPLTDVTLAGAFKLFWANLYDLREEYTATVTSRVRLACAGLKLIFGVDSPWAELLYHHCAAGAELTDGLFGLALDMFVQIPMAKCVCKDVAGQSVASFVTQRCAPGLPVSLAPTLYAIANELMGTVPIRGMACDKVLASVKTSISTSLDPWFEHQFSALDALGSSVDYATAVFDDQAGKCLDFQQDPHVVVIVPQPVDYFQRCGGTSLCKQVCAAEWQAFQAALAADQLGTRPPEVLAVSMESLFFPGELDSSLALTNVSAIVELEAGLGGCLPRATMPDFAIAVAEVAGQDVQVQVWCAPRMASSPVYRSETGAGFGPLAVPGALLDVHFGDGTGNWLVVLAQLEGASQGVFLVNRTGVFQAPAPSLPGGDVLLRIENLWVIEGLVLVDVLARRLGSYVDPATGRQGAESASVGLHFTLQPPLGTGLGASYGRWLPTTADLLQFGRGEYWYTKPAGWYEHLFLPKVQGALPFRVELARAGPGLTLRARTALAPAALPDMAGTLLSRVGQAEGRLFAASATGWDWLREVRLSSAGGVSGIFGSTPVEYNLEVQGSCSERGCEGCASLTVQRLCQAYSRCALVNCVGTPVHQRRPLCGLGGLLRQTGRMGLLSTLGAWTIFTEMLTLTLRLSLLSVKEVYLLWPEDAFLCYVCQAKDSSALFFSVLTSTVSSALQLGGADLGYMYGGASNVDTNADAVLTISSTALNAFMHQIALFSLYGLAVGHQIMMCQVSGVIALVPTGDFRLSIRGALDTPAGDLIAGQCLTVGAETLAGYPQDDTQSLGVVVTSLVSNALQRLLVNQIEPLLHLIDGLLAYAIGVTKALGALIQSQNMARCNPPDFFLQDVVACACGDDVLQIPAARRAEGLADSAHWCSGVLGMIDSNNRPYYVYNKFSYAELQAKSKGMADYVACVSNKTGYYGCAPPSEPFFKNQGVTTLNVLVKCRENFVKKRWDPAAYMLYQPAFWDLVHFQGVGIPEIPGTPRARECLTTGDAASGSLAQACLEDFLLNTGTAAEAYWAYERQPSAAGPEFTDGCLVFSGPAMQQNLSAFKACVDGETSGCTLPAHLWTPRSSNDVPLAAQHRVVSHGVSRDGLVQRLYAEAHDTVMRAIADSLAVWSRADNPAVNAEFFSVEGDVLHQTMDCMFMGPYSRVDYWPTPKCLPGEECLRGPFWSRDEQEGRARAVDPGTCSAQPTLPYTCGSAGRRSLMRYLVLHLLPNGGTQANQNGSNIGQILRATLAEMADVWGDTGRYGCPCANYASQPLSPLCCATNLSSPLLPPALNQAFTSVSAKTVLAALEDDMAALYDLALEKRDAWLRYMQDVSQNETDGYAQWAGSKRAQEEAWFDPRTPASQYASASEAMQPLAEEDGTLWDVCHASLKQIFFTLPLDAASGEVAFDATAAFDGDPARLQEFVQRFTAEAFERSPLFRHYSPRHVPSDSHMCAQPADARLDADGGTASYSAFVQNGATMLDGKDLPSGSPVYHPQRFRVGATGACLCGWARAGQRCFPPARANTFNLVCAALAGKCRADHSYDAEADAAAVLDAFSPDWYCPEFELSPHWGYLDPSAQEQWLALNATALTTSARDLFRHGRAGLRPGNLQGLPRLAKQYLSPKTRQVPLERGRLTTCQPPPPQEDLVQPFLDELFPANHGADDAGATVYCLRFAIEQARLEVLRLLLANQPESLFVLQVDEGFLRLQDEYLRQRERAEAWRRKCGTQMHLLHLCTSLGVFRPLTDTNDRDAVACPHFRVEPSPSAYVTPQCLLSVDGVFYDPCRCVACAGDKTMLLDVGALVRNRSSCALRFDPRNSMLKPNAPIGWVDGEHPLPDPQAALLMDTWTQDVLADPDATGNVEDGSPWWQAEGPMAENSEFCDSVVDWWPEGWDFPVGYHVTTPCEAAETAYRSFSQAFALNETDNTLTYVHDLLRDAALVDSHFGGTGLCRSGTFGMPMPETNNMRYCTQIMLDDTEDFALPLAYGADPTDNGMLWGEWKCTSSSTQLPWPDTQATTLAGQQSSRYSIGTIPNMPPETSATYPADEASTFAIGPVQEIVANGNRWGAQGDSLCQDYAMLLCRADADCPAAYTCRGRVCENDYSLACTADANCSSGAVCRGVCLDTGAVECIRHSDCPDDGMCSGMGTCETPVLAVQNRLPADNITLGLAAHQQGCGPTGREFSLLQGSYWGNTGRDVLRVHGMCSFEDWFKYTTAYSAPACASDGGDDTLLVDAAKCAFVDLALPSTNQTRWWPAGNVRPELMFVRPTVCDRDYERLQGFSQCAPATGAATLLYNDGRLKGSVLDFDQYVRLNDDSRRMRLARMPEMSSGRVGFLGMNGSIQSLAELAQAPFVACGAVGQCFPGTFTINGQADQRRVRLSSQSWTNYSEADAFTCGVFGLQTPAGCVLDTARFPLYAYLCTAEQRLASCWAGIDPLTQNAIARVCTGIPATYQASRRDRMAVLDGLRALFEVFPPFDTLDQYLRLTTCAADLYAAMASAAQQSQGNVPATSLYYPFMFALYELPFDWFFQCSMLSGFRLDPTTHVAQTCQAYATRAEHGLDAYRSVSPAGDAFQTYLQFVRGGYTAADVEQYRAAQRALAVAALDDVVRQLKVAMFNSTTDLSVPRCSANLLWRIGPYGERYKDDSVVPEARAVIWNWYDGTTCSSQWNSKLLAKLGEIGFPTSNWQDALTEADPDRLVPPDSPATTTILQLARAFMLAGMAVEPLDTVTTQSSGCLRFNNQPPNAYDHAAYPLPLNLEPSPSVNAGTDNMADGSVPLTCAFLPSFDPVFTAADLARQCARRDVQVGDRTDRLQTCNGVDCSAVPIYYKRNGKFNCRYVAEAVITAPCTELSPGCQTAVMDEVYAAMLLRYVTNASSLAQILAPRPFPWYQSAWPFEAVDLSAVLDYERNIQPDPERAVMCEISTSEAEAVKFTACNNPHYKRLQAHARQHYKHDGGAQIPAMAQIEWPLRRSLLARGVMLSYASTNRSIRKRYLDALFDDETVCKGDPADHVCRKVPSRASFQTLNPWLLGNFNPYEVCDVDFTSAGQGSREYISAFCLEQGNDLCPAFRANSPPGCVDKNQRLVQQVGVPRATAGVYNDYNLCFHAVEEDDDGCMHDQGLLGGYDGLPVASPADTSYNMLFGTKYEGTENYTVAPNLYENSVWSIPDDFVRGLFAGTNPLWQGDPAPYGYLRIDEDEIGGHRLGVAVQRVNASDAISLMWVEKLALGLAEDQRFLDDAGIRSRPTREWVPGLQQAMAREDAAVQALYGVSYGPADLGASCPLQRWTFYSGGYASFSPAIPAAKRARRLFHRVHGGRLAHPTMVTGTPGQFLGQYRSSNGFCACPVLSDIQQAQCMVPINDASPCSLRSTIQTLLAKTDGGTLSTVFPALNNEKATRKCEMLLDWPAVDGVLRDGTPVEGQWGKASGPTQKVCHILDRFRPFRYKYVAAQTLAQTSKTTIRDGACSTGRVVTLQDLGAPPYARCLRTGLSDATAAFACNTSSDTFTLPRRTRLTLDQLLARRASSRASCRACARPPAFKTQQGRPIPAESSFGRLHRLSPERLLAKDLREALCPTNDTGPGCPALNTSGWRRGEFMRNYMLHPERLFLRLNRTSIPATPASSPQADADWTGRPWVYCPTAGALRSGEGCVGTMTRAEWTARKTSLCPRMVRSFSAANSSGDPMARTPFCSIDNTTMAVCQAVGTARQLITQANCIARGDPDCMPSPFVYHPASYEPSNNAWIHDSVQDFYRHVNASACPASTQTDAQLVAFARAYQRACPANGVNVMVGVLQAVRTVVVDVALLLTSLLGLVFNALQLFVTSGRAEARLMIGKNWAYIRSKARASLDAVSDLLVNALLNSGEAGARIMNFLKQTCDGFNVAAAWFLNVWCNYIQKYTLQFLAGIRKFIGISGAVFDILQDFMDEVFQGILPAAFVAKYAHQAFQNALIERYAQPSDSHKKAKAGVVSVDVPDSANPKQVSRTAEKKSFIARVFGSAGKTLKGIAKASVFASIGLGLVEAIQGIMSIAQEERLRSLYPENFTLFDLSDIVNVVDDMEDFILSPLSQQTCASYQLLQKARPGQAMFSCLKVDMDSYTGTSQGTTSFEATMCWANAAPSLGQNSMFACTAASTCCQTAECTSFILCASCPEPGLPGVNRYGCDGLRQKCVCSRAQTAYDLCAANRQCGASSECELVSSLNGVSYGTIPCANCPGTAQLVCLLPPAGMPARCSCMLAGAPSYDLCSDRSGMRTAVDSSRLCGYLHGRVPDTTWAFDLDDLIILPCAQVSLGVCSVVSRGPSLPPLRMVVAETVRFTAGSGRRLLAEDAPAPEPGPPVYDAYESEYELPDSQALHALLVAPGWNTTAAPCSTLALAYQAEERLGLLETHVLKTCAFWRHVGRRVIARYNLTEALGAHETFLLSLDDLVFAAMAPEAGRAMLQNLGLFAAAALHHPWMKPVRAFGVLVANHLEYLHWIRSIDADVHEALFGDVPPEEQERQARQDALDRMQARISPREVPRRPNQVRPQDGPGRPAPHGRHLLGVQEVLAYSARVIQNPSAAGQLPAKVYGAWSTSDYAWPPRYNYSLAACPIALAALDIGTHVALVNQLYYSNFAVVQRPPPKTLRENLPDWSWTAQAAENKTDASSSSSWASWLFRSALGVVGLRPKHLVAFFTEDDKWSLTWILVSLTRCDLASTLTCSRHERDVVMSTVVFALLFLVVFAATQALGVSFLAILFLLSYPAFILWYVYGMPPSCTPLLPTCLLADVLDAVETLVPSQMLFPSSLLCDGQNQECLRPCTDLGFVNYVDPLAYAICDADDWVCTALQDLGPTGIGPLDALLWDPAREAMARFQPVIRGGSAAGHRLCTWVSFVTVVPIVVLLLASATIVTAVGLAAIDLLPSLVALLCQAFVFYEAE